MRPRPAVQRVLLRQPQRRTRKLPRSVGLAVPDSAGVLLSDAAGVPLSEALDVSILATLLIPLVAVLAGPPAPPKFEARLLAGSESISPGGRVDLVVELKLQPEWHIYHPIHGEAGGPTLLTFAAPAGVSFGPVQYPAPEAGEQSGFAYLGYYERVLLLTDVSLPADWPADRPLDLQVKVDGFACDERGCVPVEARASLELPSRSAPGAPANQELIKEARESLPKPLEKAPYLEGSQVRISKEKLGPKEKAEIVAVIKVRAGHHIQHRDPGNEDLIPTRLHIEQFNGLVFEEQVWPKPHIREMPELGKVAEQAGQFEIRAPFAIEDAKFPSGPVTLRVLLHYQTCTDAGQCFPPETAEAFVTFTADTSDPAADPPLQTVRPLVLRELPAEAAAAPTGTPAAQGGGAAAARRSGAADAALPLWKALLYALLGGMILNVMPCVLPVISLKIFGFMQQAGDEPGRVFRMGLAYGAGILASFAVLAIVMVNLSLAWGGAMQDPVYVIVMIALIFAFALSMFGVFEVRLPSFVESAAGEATAREGYGGAFMNGVFATALATPCTAPMLAPAMGVLVTLAPPVAAAGIMTVGVGMALPYVLLSAFPGWLRFLPRPGPWMLGFKQIMGFALIGTAVWLFYVLSTLVEPLTLVAVTVLLTGLALGCWVLGRISLSAGAARRTAGYATALLMLGAGWWVGFRYLGASLAPPTAAVARETPQGGDGWLPWAPGLPEKLAREGKTVYVDFTATWCLTCQANKKFVLHSDEVESALRENGVVTLLADFTRRNPDIQQELRRHQRIGVPLNIIVPAGRPEDVIVLPEILTTGVVLDALRQAGPSRATGPGITAVRAEPGPAQAR